MKSWPENCRFEYTDHSLYVFQEEMYAELEYSQGGYDYQPYGYHEDVSPPPSNFTPVKPPSIKELMKEAQEPQKEDSDGIICLVCHSPCNEYIILPSCQQPHIYCMACATKMVKHGPPVNRYNHRFGRGGKQKYSSSQTIQVTIICPNS